MTLSGTLEAFVLGLPWKNSTKAGYLVDVCDMLERLQIPVTSLRIFKQLRKAIDLALLREVPNKARLLTDCEAQKLLHVQDEEFAVVLALMLPSGARFADVARIQRRDVRQIDANGYMRLRVFRTKTIRRRVHQRWLTLVVPETLLPKLIEALEERGRSDIVVVIGGVIPNKDYSYLKKMGAAAIFGPGTVIPIAAETVLQEINRRLGYDK